MKVLLAGATGELGRALAAELLARGHEVVETDGYDAVIDASGTIDDTRGLLRAAERAGARYLLASTTLIYGDGGEEQIEAAEPIIDPAPELESAVDAELEVFASGVRFLVLRQGILFGPESGSAHQLLDAVAAGSMPAAPAWLPLLHPADFAHLATRALERDLNGLYDAVSDDVRLDDLVREAARALDAPEPRADAEAPNPNLWLVSRRVTPRALAKVGLEPRWTWQQMLASVLAARG